MNQPPETQEIWAELLVDALFASGVEHVVLSPGSRSTPLVLALLRDGRLRIEDVIDERSAGFVALGAGRVLRRPVALVCTSGSAPAHYFPALVEAEAARVPMVVLSADRPFALQRGGESQTIDQTKLFGERVRFFADLGEPSAKPADQRAMRRLVAQAVFAATHPVAGPVHLDARFVKPLEPTSASSLGSPSPRQLSDAVRAMPPPRFHAPERRAPEAALDELAQLLAACARPMVLVGPMDPDERTRDALSTFARASGVPVYVEGSSGARFAPGAGELLGAFDAVFRSESARRSLAPDLVVQIGRAPVATAYGRLAAEHEFTLVLLDEVSFLDPWSRAERVVLGEASDTLRRLADRIASSPTSIDLHWSRTLRRLDEAAFTAGEALALEDPSRCSEAEVARSVVESLPSGGRLVLGNSLAIRQVDAWVAPRDTTIEVLSQRGASGIDGLVAGLFGAQLAKSCPSVLLLGDVSLAHDLGSLALLRRLETPSVVVVVDNGGGRIFEQLPIAARVPEAMVHFETPPELDFAALGAALGLRSVRVARSAELREALDAALAHAGATLVVVHVPPHGAIAQNGRLWSAVESAVRAEVER